MRRFRRRRNSRSQLSHHLVERPGRTGVVHGGKDLPSEQFLTKLAMSLELSLFLHENEDGFGWVIENLLFDEIQYPNRKVGWEIGLEIQPASAACARKAFACAAPTSFLAFKSVTELLPA